MNRYEKARKVFETYVTQLGAVRQEGQAYRWTLNTPVGLMSLSMHSEDFSIFTRFDDVEKAKKHLPGLGLNPFSGKWNWHGMSRNDNPFEAFKLEVDAIMAMQIEDATPAAV
jgi:hypothetical protein